MFTVLELVGFWPWEHSIRAGDHQEDEKISYLHRKVLIMHKKCTCAKFVMVRKIIIPHMCN